MYIREDAGYFQIGIERGLLLEVGQLGMGMEKEQELLARQNESIGKTQKSRDLIIAFILFFIRLYFLVD